MFASNTAPRARYDSNRVLTESDFARIAPSVLSREAHASRSGRFAPIATMDVVAALAREGFSAVAAKQSTCRVAGKAPFTKHMIRFRSMDRAMVAVGDVVPEIVLRNANDGTSSYELMAGLFRLACLNGMVCQTGTLDSIKIRHTGPDVIRAVVDGTFRVAAEAVRALDAPQAWARLTLEAPQAAVLAEAAHVLRFGDADGETDTPIRPEQLLGVRRSADRASDLWTTFNVVQENVIRGGLSARGARGDDGRRGRRTTTRPVNGIDQDVRLNKALWVLGERMAALVSAK